MTWLHWAGIALLGAVGVWSVISVRAAERAWQDDQDTPQPRFLNTYCSQCGRDFGPGDHGYSHCANHQHEHGRE